MADKVIATLPLGAIVVGIDGQPHSLDAVEWAARQAALEHRPLVVLHATGTLPPLLSQVRAAESRSMRRIAGRGHTDQGLRRALAVAPNVRVEALVRADDPIPALLRLGESAHLLVVGSRGLGPVASVVRGSVSLRVASAAPCPVVVVRAAERERSRIVVGTDGTEASSAAVEFAFAQASQRGAPLTVVHAVSPPVFRVHLASESSAPAWLAESVAGLHEKYADVEARLRVACGTAATELVKRSRIADLVVVGARRRRGPAGPYLGSVSQAVIERSHCSVAVVHPQPALAPLTRAGDFRSTGRDPRPCLEGGRKL